MEKQLNVAGGTRDKTPLEIALGMGDDDMVSAKKLYGYLELHPANYAKWIQKQLLDNDALEEGVDYVSCDSQTSQDEVFIPKYENPQGGRPSIDYRVSADTAKYLALSSHSEKGKKVKNYLIKVEGYMTRELIAEFRTMQEKISAMESKYAELDRSVDIVRGSLVDMKAGEVDDLKELREWKEDMYAKCEAAGRSWRDEHDEPFSGKKVIGELVSIMKRELGIDFNAYVRRYKEKHSVDYAPVMDVVADSETLISAFTTALGRFTGESEGSWLDDFNCFTEYGEDDF